MPRLPRWVLSLALALALLAALEGALRIAGFRRPAFDFPIVVWNLEEDRLMYERDYLFQPDVRTLWTPRPGATVQFAESDAIVEHERIHAGGYRGPQLALERTPGVLRIAALGDSTTFGVAVPYAQSYCGRLPALLAERDIAAEVLDAGVDGYTVRQGLERYRSLVRPHRPDVVVAAFGAVNEHWSATDLSDDGKIRRSIARDTAPARLRRRVRSGLRLAHLAAWVRDPRTPREYWQEVLRTRHVLWTAGLACGSADWSGVRRVPLEEFPRHLEELAREVAADGARLVLLVHPRKGHAEEELPVLLEYTRAALGFAAAHDVQILDARSRVRALVRAGASEETLMHDAWHPTAAGHGLIAAALTDLVLDPTLHRRADPHSEPLE